jgi:proline dehydrogenase
MPGERFENALAAAQEQQGHGIGTIFTHLGENLSRSDQADAVAAHYVDVVDRIHSASLDAHISIKPTQLGLDIDAQLCRSHLFALIDRVNRYSISNGSGIPGRGPLVWIDMESSVYLDRTLKLFTEACERSTHVGIAIQAYLRRTPADLDRILPFAPAIRLVKGAYLEPPSLAYARKRDVDESYERLGHRLLAEAGRTRRPLVHLATHDARLVHRLEVVARQERVPNASLEFAMLFGIQRPLQLGLAGKGHRVRVLIAYGNNWFPWYMRRLAERPANLWFVVKNLART